jgi:hypothetical protein
MTRELEIRHQTGMAFALAVLAATMGLTFAEPGVSQPHVQSRALAKPSPEITAVRGAYAGSGLFGSARLCDQAVKSRTAFRIVWRAYRLNDSLWRTNRARLSTERTCVGARTSFRNAPQGEDHYLVVTVTNLATGRSDTARGSRAVTT